MISEVLIIIKFLNFPVLLIFLKSISRLSVSLHILSIAGLLHLLRFFILDILSKISFFESFNLNSRLIFRQIVLFLSYRGFKPRFIQFVFSHVNFLWFRSWVLHLESFFHLVYPNLYWFFIIKLEFPKMFDLIAPFDF